LWWLKFFGNELLHENPSSELFAFRLHIAAVIPVSNGRCVFSGDFPPTQRGAGPIEIPET
jgi:hypothetical protein